MNLLLMQCLVWKESCEMLARLETDSLIALSVHYCSLKSLRPLDLSPTFGSSLLCDSLHYIGPKIAQSRSVAITETHTG